MRSSEGVACARSWRPCHRRESGSLSGCVDTRLSLFNNQLPSVFLSPPKNVGRRRTPILGRLPLQYQVGVSDPTCHPKPCWRGDGASFCWPCPHATSFEHEWALAALQAHMTAGMAPSLCQSVSLYRKANSPPSTTLVSPQKLPEDACLTLPSWRGSPKRSSNKQVAACSWCFAEDGCWLPCNVCTF